MKSKEFIITSAMLILITYTLALSAVNQAYSAGQTSKTLSSTGSIQIQTSEGIGIYSNYQCTTALSSISWGTLEPGTNQNIDFYIKNEGSSPTTLSLQTSNWIPSTAGTYLNLDWNYNGAPISPNSSVHVTLTLTVASNIEDITNFSFQIIIVGST